jgi:hypothetical protein
MVHEVGQYLLQLEEKPFAWCIAVGEHVEGNSPLPTSPRRGGF